jgi:hypothetical protein
MTRRKTLQAKAFTDLTPDPLLDQGCTTASLSRPVEWRLQPTYAGPPIFMAGQMSQTTFGHAESELRFVLNNSALAGDWDKGGLVEYISAEHDTYLTPYLPGFKPTHLYGEPGDLGFEDNHGFQRNRGFPHANNLAWNLRFDASSGYLELSHTWFCIDKDPSHP